jgi:gas vesicle protein
MADEEKGACLSTIVISFLAGAAIGSGLALLFAPKTGREVREQIKDLTDDAVDRIREYARDAQEKLIDTLESGKELVKEKKSIISTAIEAGKEAMEKERERISEEHKA